MPQNVQVASLLGKLAEYIEAFVRNPRSKVFVPLSETYRQLGQLEDAVQTARQGVEVHPGFAPGYVALGRAQAQAGSWEEAAQAFAKALSLEKDNLPALKGLARVYLRQGQQDKARPVLQRLQQLQPEDPEVGKMIRTLGPAAETGKQPATAVKSEKEAGSPIKTATLAEIYVRQGLYREALKVYREILAANPDNQEIRSKALAVKKRLEQEAAAAPDQPRSPAAAATAAGGEAPASPPPPKDTGLEVMERLQSWLDAIQQRREHVQ